MAMVIRSFRALFLAMLFGIGTLGMVGCEEGRFEEAGEEVDEAGDEMQDRMDEAGDEVD